MNAGDGSVLIAYDGSAAARQAVADAVGLLGPRRMLVVTVWEEGLAYATSVAPPTEMMMTPVVDPGLAIDVDREVRRQADAIAREGAELATSLGADAEPVAVPDSGGVADTLLAVARDRQAAAIVVGSRGLSGLRARLEGSTSKGVLRDASCPVIVVHEHDTDGA